MRPLLPAMEPLLASQGGMRNAKEKKRKRLSLTYLLRTCLACSGGKVSPSAIGAAAKALAGPPMPPSSRPAQAAMQSDTNFISLRGWVWRWVMTD